MSGTNNYRDRNSTADRALTILGLFSDDNLHLGAADVATALDCSRSTAYRYLQTLASSGFLEEAPGGGYRLGLRVLELARMARRGYGLSDVALPTMRALAIHLGETVVLTRRLDDAVICIDRCEGSSQLVRLSYERGARLPINAGASAQVLLAWASESEQRRVLTGSTLQRFTPNTLTSIDALTRRFAEIRKKGYSVTIAEVDPDAMGIAAPIMDDEGTVTAALSVVALRRRVPEERLSGLVAEVRSAAARVTDKLSVVGS